MNLNNFTIKAQEVVQKAVQLTRDSGNQAIEPEHLLKAIMTEGDAVLRFIFQKLDINPANTFGVVCGPPVMYKFVVQVMREKNIDYDHIYLDFERHMKCGMGKCGHCQIGHQYCCIDGPVFNYWEAKNIQGSM